MAETLFLTVAIVTFSLSTLLFYLVLEGVLRLAGKVFNIEFGKPED